MSAAHHWRGAVRRSLNRVIVGAMFLLAIKEMDLWGKCGRKS